MATLTTFLKLLKPEKNDYVDVEKHISENYDKIDTEFLKIDTKFKNYCPISVGSIDVRYDNKNPAELYPSTTWELITSGKYIQTGNTPLSTGGSNSISISKTNLPNVKLKVDSFSVTTKAHNHAFPSRTGFDDGSPTRINVGAPIGSNMGILYTNNGGGQNTGTASPSTETLGNGTALIIQPEYITLKFWKRLT